MPSSILQLLTQDNFKIQVDQILESINTLGTAGGTNLYGAMRYALQDLQTSFASNSHSPSTLIAFTDGSDTKRECTEGAITSQARKLSMHNPQFAMYLCGLNVASYYNPAFFNAMGSGSGFTTVDIGNISQMSEFKQYLDVINNARELWEFVTDGTIRRVEHVSTGDIHVASVPVDIGTVQVIHGSVTVGIGVNEEKNEEPPAAEEDAGDPSSTQYISDSSVLPHDATATQETFHTYSAYNADLVGSSPDLFPSIECIIS